MVQDSYFDPRPGEVLDFVERMGLEYKERGEEIMFPCLNGCDDDDRESEKYHCSINSRTGQFHCFKCEDKGNLITLKSRFGDSGERNKTMVQQESAVVKESSETTEKPKSKSGPRGTKLSTIAKNCHKALMENSELRNRLMQERKLSLTDLNIYNIGYGEFYGGQKWFTIPIVEDGECKFIKLRRMFDDDEGAKYMVYPGGSESVVFGATDLKKSRSASVLICGGEIDKINADKMGFDMPTITSTAGEGTFKDEWIMSLLDGRSRVYLAFDNDDKGRDSTEKISKQIVRLVPNIGVYQVSIPPELGDKADITDAYKAGYTGEQLLANAKLIAGEPPAKASDFGEMSIDDLIKVLSITIRYDDMNKAIIFLAMLSTYTTEEQMNVFLNAKSSSGKTYLVTEVAKLFPKIDIKKYARVTPTAFYYDENSMSTDENGDNMLDMEKKILIFLDQIDTQLQEKLRPLMSHDDKRLPFLLTNRSKSGTNSANGGYILGFPSTFFCSANMKMDEQESTRAILLSPEITQEKIEAGIDLVIEINSNASRYSEMVENNPDRKSLVNRIKFIREMEVEQIIIPKELNAGAKFKALLPNKRQARNQRDAKHFNSFIKVHALLNAMNRKRSGNDIVAEEKDVEAAIRIWKFLGRSQMLGVPPQTLSFYDQFVVPAYRKKNPDGKTANSITLNELNIYYQGATGEFLNQDMLKRQHIPVLQNAGLISYDKDPGDRRQRLIKPLYLPNSVNQSFRSSPLKEGGDISFSNPSKTEENNNLTSEGDKSNE